jgi:hypothetical protein
MQFASSDRPETIGTGEARSSDARCCIDITRTALEAMPLGATR